VGGDQAIDSGANDNNAFTHTRSTIFFGVVAVCDEVPRGAMMGSL
jgi:hypothetical protein